MNAEKKDLMLKKKDNKKMTGLNNGKIGISQRLYSKTK